MKRYMNTALLYAILAMVGGVFYREFTKAIPHRKVGAILPEVI